MDELFRATVEATEESILNALVAAETMTGINGNRIEAISHPKLKALFKGVSLPSSLKGSGHEEKTQE
jgi:D-aminopeptidase